ncbi:hypothetical protein FQA47_001555 [Oryzias melastigma]|uniref:Uncharacterized protein n=1 Tax=Oryzias melastigma TaxID=30732 RepID=A0A834FS44_ORYME|nr:hypothetical protein FQA47_001555 [Oryzias melastigma]
MQILRIFDPQELSRPCGVLACLHLITRSAGLALQSDILPGVGTGGGWDLGRKRGGGGWGVLALCLLSRAEAAPSGPAAGVDSVRGRCVLPPLQKWHHSEPARPQKPAADGADAADAAVTWAEDSRMRGIPGSRTPVRFLGLVGG